VIAGWIPSEHTIVLAGVAAAGVLVACVLVATRDAWITQLEAHRNLVRRGVVGAAVVVVVALGIAHLSDLEELVDRVEQGAPAWLAVGVGTEIVSFGGYVVLTYVVHRPRAPRLDWVLSTELTLAGVVATRVFSAGGAGGIAFTGWALHRVGMGVRLAARQLTAFMILLYSVYIAALLLGGILVVTGALPRVPTLLGVVAMVVGGVVTVLAFALVLIPADLERRVEALEHRSGWVGRLATRLATVPQVAGNGARLALSIARERPTVLLWSLVWWAFDVATLWAAFHAFGDPPATGTLVLCYFLGQMGNLLPLPGGVGGAEGGMVGAFAASGVDAGLALLAVVSYQLISTYLPALPGLASYLDLRRRMRSWEGEEESALQKV
jgi:uncharacterized membrane protein YbhN (UPF0104 family)